MDGLFQINFLLPKKNHIFTVTSFTCFMFFNRFLLVFFVGIQHGWLDTGHRGGPKVLQQLLTIMAILGTVTFIVTLGLDFLSKTQQGGGAVGNTPWKINMEPRNHPFGKENDLPNLHDDVPC